MSRGRSRLGMWWRRFGLRVARVTQPVLGPFRARWRRSLGLRTMTITGAVTGVMIFVAGVFILTSTSEDLYSQRRDQALYDSARATVAAQRILDASDATDRGSVSTLFTSVSSTVQETSESQMVYVRRQPGQAVVAEVRPDFWTSAALTEAVTPELAAAVARNEEPQYWQAVSFSDEDGDPMPGIVVASTLTFPAGAGVYDLYLGYDLTDTQETMNFIGRTLLITALMLMLFVGALVWIMTRVMFRPIRAAADASRRLSEGQGDARMAMQNDVYFDQLSENFNDMADTLQARIEELDHLSEMQQRFVSDVSHELRTPLTTIRLATEVLRGQLDALEASQTRAVEVLGAQVDRFEELLRDLLEISRYDAGRVTLETEPTNLVALTQAVVDQLQPLSKSLIEVRPLGGYTSIEVDPRRIRRIVSNLVGNAIEHGEGHPIVVTIDSNAAAMAVTVRDWGIGMDADQTARVFDRFWRADPSRKRTLGGTGLGLAIAQEDAAVHGGLLDVWSRPGQGTNFRLTLPRGEETASYVSPLPLVPEDVDPDEGDPQKTGGWLRRPKRRVTKAGKP